MLLETTGCLTPQQGPDPEACWNNSSLGWSKMLLTISTFFFNSSYLNVHSPTLHLSLMEKTMGLKVIREWRIWSKSPHQWVDQMDCGSNLSKGETNNLDSDVKALKGALQPPKKPNFQQHFSHELIRLNLAPLWRQKRGNKMTEMNPRTG